MKLHRILIYAIIFSALIPKSITASGNFIAYSLRVSEQHIKNKQEFDLRVFKLAGITSIAGLVYDSQSKDLILVGRVNENLPDITLDDFVVALHSRLGTLPEWPYVSIDRTEKTKKTGKQMIVFKGTIQNTRFGKDLLLADILLKKLAFGLPPSENSGIISYFSNYIEHRAKNTLEDLIGSRFWFYIMGTPSFDERPGVLVISNMQIGVKTEVMYATQNGKPLSDLTGFRDTAGDAFSNQMTMEFLKLCTKFPEIARIKSLLDLVALAEMIRQKPPKINLNYWIKDYNQQEQVRTPNEYNLLKRQEKIAVNGKVLEVELNGGIELKTRVLRLNLQAGNVLAFRDAVMNSRPDENSLAWKVPLEGWEIPEAPPTPEFESADTDTTLLVESEKHDGFFLEAQVREAGAPILNYNKPISPLRIKPPDIKIYNKVYRNDQNLSVDQSGWTWGPENMAWHIFNNPLSLFDATYAKKWYAQKAAQALSSAKGSGVSAGLEATTWDLSGAEPIGITDRLGNFIGRNWNWFGRNVSGGQHGSFDLDEFGQYPLGNPTVGGANWIDWTARRHDIQYFIDTHYKKDDWIRMEGPFRDEYFKSRGSPIRANIELIWELINPTNPFKFFNKHLGSKEAAGSDVLDLTRNSRENNWTKTRRKKKRDESPADNTSFLFGLPPGGGPPPPPPPPPPVPLSPSPVGGVALSGAGKILDDIGGISGIAIDEQNGRLVLLSEDKGEIDLPPLRMDDVVTVFRSVYEHGQAPSVSIDPDPVNPKGKTLVVRHGAGTENSYVGWVLFEADRMMKAYSLGFDNITGQPVKTQITGYEEVLNAGLSGTLHQEVLERFWIVPAEVKRRRTANGRLTLFDVPLKVNTQRMVMRNGNLKPAPDDRASESARAFAKWFTTNYDSIAIEAYSLPPENTGLTTPVAVFSELQRIALIAAIAENLRDQSVPMPFWMRDYHVESIPISATTPAITIERSNQVITRRIYGGVKLSPKTKDIRTIAAEPEADSLLSQISQAIAKTPDLTSFPVENGNKRYKAVVMPGLNTKALAPCRLEELDIEIPVQREATISLVRKFNSFFQPAATPFGTPWTLDLPQLVMQQIPVAITDDSVQFKTVYELITPLNSHSGRFTKVMFVSEANTELLVPTKKSSILGLIGLQLKLIGYPTQALLFRDGRQWHFDSTGSLIAIRELPLTTVYRRDSASRIRRIEGWYGDTLRADIQIKYELQGRMASAIGSNGDIVKYSYDKNGLLSEVEKPEGKLTYRYKDGFVTDVLREGQPATMFSYTEFIYNQQGRLIREMRGDGSEIVYDIASNAQGHQVKAFGKNGSEVNETIFYDSIFRPVQQFLADSTQIQWRYLADKSIQTEIILPNKGERYIVNRSPDGRRRILQSPDGNTYQSDFDESGRLVALTQNNDVVLQQRWHSNGLLASANYETYALRPKYRSDWVHTATIVTPPGDGPNFKYWRETEFYESGKAKRITDYSGSEINLGYDESGELATILTTRGGMQIERNTRRQIEQVETSWGYSQKNIFGANGEIVKIEITNRDSSAVIELEHGKAKKLRHFDGSKFEIFYFDTGYEKDLIKEMQTPYNHLIYEYDDASRISAIHLHDAYRLKYIRDAKGRIIEVRQISVDK